MSESPAVKDTAFWTAHARAMHPKLSRDPFAKDWTAGESSESYENFMAHVHEFDSYLVALRNRFYLECLEAFFAQYSDAVLVNIGAGFSSYPFLLGAEGIYYEIDCAANIALKQMKRDELDLPQRNLQFFTADLGEPEALAGILAEIRRAHGDRRCLFLLEGVIYYFAEPTARRLLANTVDSMAKGDQLGLVTLTPAFGRGAVFAEFCRFAEHVFGAVPEFAFFENQEISSYDGLKLVTHRDYRELVKEYGVDGIDMSLPFYEEELFLLEKS